MRLRKRSRPFAAVLLAAAVLLSSPAHAGWEEDYKKGKEAYDKGRPGEAIRFLRSAISKKDEEKANAIKASGMFFEPYIPHFYLGMALFQRKEFEAAIQEFKKSESMGVIQKSKDLHAQMRQTRTAAEAAAAALQETPPAQPPPQQPPEQIAQQQPPETGPPARTAPPTAKAPPSPAEPPAKPPEPSRNGPVTARPETFTPPSKAAGPDPALRQAVNAAAGEIGRAEKFKVDSGRYLDDVEKRRIDTLVTEIRNASTAAEANAKRQDLQRLLEDLAPNVAERRRAEEERAGALAKNRALKEAIDRAAPTIQEAEAFTSARRAALEPAEAQRLNSRIAAVRSATSPEAVDGAARWLSGDLAAIKRAVADRSTQDAALARRQFARGIEAYFDGRYDEALPALEQASRALPKDADLFAYVGSSLYRKYLLTRPADPSLKSRAEQAFREALAAKPGYVLDEKYFPPKVVAFFREVAEKR